MEKSVTTFMSIGVSVGFSCTVRKDKGHKHSDY